jgi:hypothetical protein
MAAARAIPLAPIAVFGALCIMVGIYWDISWHMTIGRDSFWTPAHLLLQAGGLIAGLASGWVALRTTFGGGDAAGVDSSVRFWGFRAPLGAWVCIWGCAAMLVSAPFDNWWHDAYGLDVKIVSPPHTVLAMGIYAICWGALLLTLARQNRATGREQRRWAVLFVIAGGFLLMNFVLFLTEFSLRFLQHDPAFYRVTALLYPFALVSIARASILRWAATLTAAVCMGLMLILMWVLQLFPATPGLGPIYQPITHYVTLAFPPLLIAPGVAIDLVRQQLEGRAHDGFLAVELGIAFVVAFVLVQWPFATFLVENPAARNWFFNADNYPYWAPPAFEERSHRFAPVEPGALASGLALAVVIASASSWLGLAWGRWMTRVRR